MSPESEPGPVMPDSIAAAVARAADAEAKLAAQAVVATQAAVAVAADAEAKLAAQAVVETQAAVAVAVRIVAEAAAEAARAAEAAVAAAARTVAEAAAEAARAVAAAVDANAAAVAAAAAAAAAVQSIEARLAHEVLHDDLTGLANRRLLDDRLTQALARAKRTGTSVAVLFLDLDQFKRINDTLGHAVGDQVLIEVARRLQACLRDTDTCARVGGDEFVVVCEDLGHPSDGSLLVSRLESALAAGVPVGDETIAVRASIGIAVGSTGSLPLDLLQQADAAMYRAKEETARTGSRRPTNGHDQ